MPTTNAVDFLSKSTAQAISILLIRSTMQITQCLHAAILVSDLERAEHFIAMSWDYPR